jgi:hypothetical protein
MQPAAAPSTRNKGGSHYWKTTVRQRLTFLKVPLWTAVPIPPLEIAIEDQ